MIICHRKFSNINLDDSPELASWHGQHWNQVITGISVNGFGNSTFTGKRLKEKVTPWNQETFVALADTSSEGFQSFERVDNSNEIDRSLKIEVFSSWRFSQLRSWRSRGSGWCHGWHRRKSPKIYTQVGTLHCNRSNVSQVSSRLIPGYIRGTVCITCFHVLVDVSQFLDSQHCTNGSFILPKTNIVFQKGERSNPTLCTHAMLRQHRRGISKVEVIHCTWNSSVQEAEQHDWSWSIKVRKITGGKVQGVSPRGERVGCLSKDVGKIHALEKLKVSWYFNVWYNLSICFQKETSQIHNNKKHWHTKDLVKKNDPFKHTLRLD